MSNQAVDQILKQNNPFAQPPLVSSEEIWNTDNFLDLEVFNKHVSDTVLQAVNEIKQRQYNATTILMLGDRSSGKSHLMRRLHYRIHQDHSGLFILIGSLNVQQPRESFQELLSASLRRNGPLEISQWNALATKMFQVIRQHKKQSEVAPAQLIHLLNQEYQTKPQKMVKFIENLVQHYLEINKSIQDEDIVKAIFWTLLKQEANSAYKWLGGQEIAAYKAEQLHLPTQYRSLTAINNILGVLSQHYEVIICFDELDTSDFDEAGSHRSEVAANLIKDLFQTLSRGLILTSMNTSTWKERVTKNTPQSVYGKVTAQGNPLLLTAALNEELAIELIKRKLAKFYEDHGVTPPHDLYPLEVQDIRDVTQERPPIRKFLEWCRDHYLDRLLSTQPTVEPVVTVNPVEESFKWELKSILESHIDDDEGNYLVSTVLMYWFQRLTGRELENILIQSVTNQVQAGKKAKTDKHINFRIDGMVQGKPYSIGVAVLQQDGGRSLGAGLKKLLKEQRQDFPMDRGCLVRSQAKTISSHLYNTYIIPLTEKEGGEFINLVFEEVHPLIAFYNIYKKIGTDYDFSPEDLDRFINDQGEKYRLGEFSPLLREILSDPSEQAPELEHEPSISSPLSQNVGQDEVLAEHDIFSDLPQPELTGQINDEDFERIFGKLQRGRIDNLF